MKTHALQGRTCSVWEHRLRRGMGQVPKPTAQCLLGMG
jgi:hypothetical protein